MRNKRNCSWSTIQLFKKFFSLLRSIRIDLFLLFTFGCSYSCFIHWHIVSLNGPCDTIRTCDHCVPNAELYQAELHTVNTGAGRESRTPHYRLGRPLDAPCPIYPHCYLLYTQQHLLSTNSILIWRNAIGMFCRRRINILKQPFLLCS